MTGRWTATSATAPGSGCVARDGLEPLTPGAAIGARTATSATARANGRVARDERTWPPTLPTASTSSDPQLPKVRTPICSRCTVTPRWSWQPCPMWPHAACDKVGPTRGRTNVGVGCRQCARHGTLIRVGERPAYHAILMGGGFAYARDRTAYVRCQAVRPGHRGQRGTSTLWR